MIRLIQTGAARDYAIYFETPTGYEANTIYIGWTNQTAVQMRYRTCHRPIWDGQETDDTAWGNWTTTYTTTTPYVVMAGMRAYNVPLTLSSADFTGSYDQLKVQVQVRSCDSSGNNPGAWETVDLPINYFPEPGVVSCELREDFSIDLTIDPGMPRPIRDLIINDSYDSDGQQTVPPGNIKLNMSKFRYHDWEYNDSGEAVLHIPAELANYIPRSGGSVSLRMVTYDGVGAYRRLSITVTVPTGSTHLDDFTPVFTVTDPGLEVSVPHSAGGGSLVPYEGVSVSYSWTDSRGAETAGTIDLVKDSNWTGTIPAPPYGVTVSYNVTVRGTYSGVTIYKTVSGSEDMPGSKWFTLTHGEEVVAIGYNLSFSRSLDNTLEVIQTASGRNLSRHGLADSSSLNLTGTIMDAKGRGTLSSIWLPEMESLSAPHDWVLRTPNGERFNVAVGSFSESATAPGWEDISIDMNEVTG